MLCAWSSQYPHLPIPLPSACVGYPLCLPRRAIPSLAQSRKSSSGTSHMGLPRISGKILQPRGAGGKRRRAPYGPRDPEVPEKAQQRKCSAEDKKRIQAEWAVPPAAGARNAMLPRCTKPSRRSGVRRRLRQVRPSTKVPVEVDPWRSRLGGET